MSNVLIHLKAEGYTEAEVREHSMDWVLFASEQLDRRYRLRLSNETILMGQAYGAIHDAETGEAFQQSIQELRGMDDEDLAYMLDPKASFDRMAASQSGLLMPRQPKEATPDA